MNETNNDQNQKPRTSKLAKDSFICVIISTCLLVLSLCLLSLTGPDDGIVFLILIIAIPVGIIVCLILGVAALIQIMWYRGRLASTKRAVGSIFIAAAAALIAFGWFYAVVSKWSCKLSCGSNVKGLGTVFQLYAYEYDGRLPTAENWCDLFICHVDVDAKSFRCPESDAIDGESTYALNENIVGMKPSEIPGDVVLMFETSLGRTGEGRTGQVKSRGYFQFFAEDRPPELYSPEQKKEGNRKVYIDRWNQVGGPEDLTTRYHKGIGCNVLFADFSAAFIKKEGLDTLRWKP